MMKELETVLDPGTVMTRDRMLHAAAKDACVHVTDVAEVKLLRKSLDARGGKVKYRYRIAYCLNGDALPEYRIPEYRYVKDAEPVIVVGAGPAGMFAALRLLMEGMKPVVLERGKDVHSRKFDIAAVSRDGILNPDSNLCFGEGGAGTFSDGKLYTRSSKRGDIREVLHQLVGFGADPSILTDAHPHIGSDRLPAIVEAVRNAVVSMGGEYHFGARVSDLERNAGAWNVRCSDNTVYSAKYVILATGHSSRDIYELFMRKGWALEAKGFALGVRAEHPQELIDRIQYGKEGFMAYRSAAYGIHAHGGRGIHGVAAGKSPVLPAAEYSLVTQVEGRGVFSFCMCPGGILMPSSTEDDGTVLNGMSNSRRNSRWANSGIVVSVNPGDVPEFGKHGVFSLLEFQRAAERAAYAAVNSCGKSGISRFAAPAQRLEDFCRGKVSSNLPDTSYAPGAVSLPLDRILPGQVASRIKMAMKDFDRKMRGYFTNEAMLLGVESRTSSPVRIPRDPETLQHVGNENLYPCGEGAGYSGGIVSSAVDGIRAAEAVTLSFRSR